MKYHKLFFSCSILMFLCGSAEGANSCYSSILHCGGAPSTDMEAALSTSSARGSADGCYSAVKSLRSTCKIKSPVGAMYFSNGILRASFYIVTRKPSHNGASCALAGVTVPSGSYEPFYNASVIYGDRDSCQWHMEMRQCIDGYLGGPTTYKYSECTYRGSK